MKTAVLTSAILLAVTVYLSTGENCLTGTAAECNITACVQDYHTTCVDTVCTCVHDDPTGISCSNHGACHQHSVDNCAHHSFCVRGTCRCGYQGHHNNQG